MNKKTKLILLLATIILLLFQFNLNAQQYQPIPDSNAAWMIEEDDGFGGLHYNRFSLSPTWEDTIINNLLYTKLYYRFDVIGNTRYHGAFRNGENGKSYWVKRNSQDEYLLRDFTRNAGDTIKNVAYEHGLVSTWVIDFIVDSTEFTNSEPYTYKIMYLSTVIEDTIPEQGYQPLVWIEKIGSFGGGILNSFSGGLGMKVLYCMQYNDTIYYDSPIWVFRKEDITYQYGTCYDPVGIKEKEIKDLDINIVPNPISSNIIIKNLPEFKKIELYIYNFFGQIEYQKTLLNNQLNQQISITPDLLPGVYVLKIY